ncbi:MAG: DNA helicase UvrD, partial [Betaproteobacteria bacterium]
AAHYGDVAVLAKTNDGVKKIAAALRAASIPWATEQPGLLSTPEALLALACLRRLNDVRDTLASAEIASLADCEEPESWLADRLRYLQAGGDSARWREAGEGAHPLLARIAELRGQARLLSPRAAMELVIAQCDLPGRVLCWRRSELVGRVRLANLQALVALARTYEDACLSRREPATLSGMLLWFGDQTQGQLDMLAQPAVDAVKVMTHHGAKGLEWPIVILMDLEKDIKDRLWSVGARSETALDVAAPLKGRWIRYWPWPFGAQRKVEIAEAIAQSEEGVRIRAEAIDEAKRLLYVSMTRARDFLVIALPAKTKECALMNELGAPWLLGEEGTQSLRLAKDLSIPYRRAVFDPPQALEHPAEDDGALRWFKPADCRSARLPAVVLASAAPGGSCKVVETREVGTRVKLKSAVDMAALGSAVHACVAAAITSSKARFDTADANRILQGFGVAGAIDSTALVGQIGALERWIEARWPDCRRHPEIPVEGVLPNGQVVYGRIDLLLDTQSGWVLIDHKSNPAPKDRWHHVAAEHVGQLSMYASALSHVTGRPVNEVWILLPIAAGAIRIDTRPG